MASPGVQEIRTAADWLANTFVHEPELRVVFSSRMQELLAERFKGHWYPDEPHRGCAYRAVTWNPHTADRLLIRAAEHAGIRDPFSLKPAEHSGELILWINPGEVKLLRGKGVHYLWSDGSASENPYSKLRIKMEPTRLNVRYDNPEPSGSPGQAMRRAPSSPADPYSQRGAPAASQDGSVTPPPFGHENFMQASAEFPPSMAPLPPQMGGPRSDGLQQPSQGPPRASPMRGLPQYACSSAAVF